MELGELYSHPGAEINSGIRKKIVMKARFFPGLLVFTLAINSCAINLDQSPANGPQQNTSIAWASLNITGKLIYNTGVVRDDKIYTYIQSLDLVTGEITIIYQSPGGDWVDALTISPDATWLIMSYIQSVSTGRQETLYNMPMDASQPPQPFFIPSSEQDQYSQPFWSPDGKYVYFAHFNYMLSSTYEIMRIAYLDGEPEKLVDHAYWPRLSDDGTRLVYVSLDPETGTNSLFIANADGTNPQPVPLTDLPVPNVIDAPMFSSDNHTILFSSPVGIQASAPHWFDKIMGVTIASADGIIPSDWWSVPVSGGKPTQLTHIHSLGLFGSFSPDKKYIASHSAEGIFIMKPDGTEILMLVNDTGGISGTVSWLP